MEFLLSKEFLTSLGVAGPVIGVLLVWLRERGEQIKSLLLDLKAERETNKQLQQQFLQATQERALAGTQVGVAMAASNDKFADRIQGLETQIQILMPQLQNMVGNWSSLCKAPK
jgi:hypothetical protein